MELLDQRKGAALDACFEEVGEERWVRQNKREVGGESLLEVALGAQGNERVWCDGGGGKERVGMFNSEGKGKRGFEHDFPIHTSIYIYMMAN